MIRFSKEANEIIGFARIIASNLGHGKVGTEHLLLALLGRKKSEELITKKYLSGSDITYGRVLDEVVNLCGRGDRTSLSKKHYTKNLETVISKAYIRAYSRGVGETMPEDIAHALFSEPQCTAVKIAELCKSKRDFAVFKTDSLTFDTIGAIRRDTPTLNRYSTDITMQALEGKLDPVLERDTEIERVIEVLIRKNKNNPCLVGAAGVGKSAIAEGLAERIVTGRVPSALSGKRVVSVDIAALLGGAKYRGDFEERIRGIIDETKRSGNVILMIDEIHNIVGAGAGEGTLDAANILKPELARGNISVIGATTPEEWSRSVEKDRALERRFMKISVGEPSCESTLRILKGIKKRYEEHHGITIDDSALKCAVDVSVREIQNRFLPDKAIDLVDGGAARVRIRGGHTLTEFDIFNMVKQYSFKIDRTYLERKIAGQKKAIDTICSTLSSLSGRRVASLLFAGPSGVGKSECALAISNALLGESALVRVDLSEYTEPHSVARLIGAPPGYVGYGEKGILAASVSSDAPRVFLFDEAEKAHPNVTRALLGIMDSGKAVDSSGRVVSFFGSLFIFTVCTLSHRTAGGFIRGAEKNDIVKSLFGNEFLGRLDAVAMFEGASYDGARMIYDRYTGTVRDTLFDKGITLEIDREVFDALVGMSDLNSCGYRAFVKQLESAVRRETDKAVLYGKKCSVRIYVGPSGEITSFSEFRKLNLEKAELSMYNELKAD